MNVAIIAVGYNRPKSLARLLESLKTAKYDSDKVPLIVSLDKADNREVEDVATGYAWPHGEKHVIIRPERLGLRRHILECGTYTSEFDAVIVLEDDLYVSPLFYRFAVQAIERYGDDENIAGISLYSHLWNVNCSRPFIPEDDGTDAYFLQFAQSWGQVWNKRMWQEFHEWYVDNASKGCHEAVIPAYVRSWPESSWLKYHIAYVAKQNKHFVYPRTSLTTNCGDVGQHAARQTTTFQVPLLWGDRRDFRLPDFNEDAVIYDVFWERQGLGRHLRLPDHDLCVDLYGTQGNPAGRRYWLTMKRSSYEPVTSFGLAMRPHEANIRLNIPGSDIFLYDTKSRLRAQDRSAHTVCAKRGLYDIRSIDKKALLCVTLHEFAAAIKRRVAAFH